MTTLGWKALGQWGEDAARIEPLTGGVANDVWSVRVHGHLAVGRLGARSDADLAWETKLLQHLNREGLHSQNQQVARRTAEQLAAPNLFCVAGYGTF